MNLRMCESVGAVAADPDVVLVVDRDAVIRPRPDVALGPGRPTRCTRLPSGSNSSTGGAGVQHSLIGGFAPAPISVCWFIVSLPVHDEDVIARVDAHADRVAQHPVVRQRLGPERVDLEPRRLTVCCCASACSAALPDARSPARSPRKSHL